MNLTAYHNKFSSKLNFLASRQLRKLWVRLLGFMALMLLSCSQQPAKNNATQIASNPKQHQSAKIAPPVQRLEHSPLLANTQASPPELTQDLWLHIAANSHIVVPNRPDIAVQQQFYRQQERFFQTVNERATPFLYFIVSELERRKMPLELALLPIVESAYNPLAQNRSPAGLWQMVPQTGKAFGLKQNAWYDGRKDVIASTNAVFDYLQHLYDTLGNDWLNAVAAYNTGEMRLQNAIARNKAQGKATDFWSLQIPGKYTVSVPKWLALINLLKDSSSQSALFLPIANKPVIGVVSLKGPIDLQQAAHAAAISYSSLKQLNPGFRQGYSSPEGPHQLVLPIGQIDLFTDQQKQLKIVRLTDAVNYQVKAGDSLGSIADKYKVSVKQLKRLNRLPNDNLQIGQRLVVRSGSADNQAVQAALQKNNTTKNSEQRTTSRYQVQSGDSLWSISQQQRLDTEQLRKLNKLPAAAKLQPGQWLTLPNTAAVVPVDIIDTHTVKSGDSLEKIANQYRAKVADLIKWNQLQRNAVLKPGQQLKIRPKA